MSRSPVAGGVRTRRWRRACPPGSGGHGAVVGSWSLAAGVRRRGRRSSSRSSWTSVVEVALVVVVAAACCNEDARRTARPAGAPTHDGLGSRARLLTPGTTIAASTERGACTWPNSPTTTSWWSKRCDPRSAGATEGSPPCIRPTCSARCSKPRSTGPGSTRSQIGQVDRRVRQPGRRADVQHRAHGLAQRRAPARGRGDHRRQPVRIVAAGDQPRGVDGRGPASSTSRCRAASSR